MKKLAIISGAVILLAAAGVAWSLSSPEPVGVSKVKGDPAGHVGKLMMTANAGRSDAEAGLLEVADEKACCTLVLAVPFTAEQQAALKTGARYEGTLPDAGAPLEIAGTLRKVGDAYSFDVNRIKSGGKVIIKRI
jgi:hypothetical protein